MAAGAHSTHIQNMGDTCVTLWFRNLNSKGSHHRGHTYSCEITMTGRKDVSSVRSFATGSNVQDSEE